MMERGIFGKMIDWMVAIMVFLLRVIHPAPTTFERDEPEGEAPNER